ncbi:hypothetical protein CMMCAS02_01720 [Clavibacter michiganensis subsp. michiganensis]|nr:hypothetical protein CMMCAS02_01720 [Clavibacter michiganensis subsp. michiganensis]OUD90324.1 hypothetical protein CMMCAS03_10150 [Clavibacter michiganensis subsp. michiganensis]OUE14848.1 hypothetical protein CMMCA002_01695 [Clavibacter michiganensis subsp. michiganensis]
MSGGTANPSAISGCSVPSAGQSMSSHRSARSSSTAITTSSVASTPMVMRVADLMPSPAVCRAATLAWFLHPGKARAPAGPRATLDP